MGPLTHTIYSHITPIRIRKDMGIVWEAYHKGVPCPWESLESPLNQPTHWMVLQESAMAAEQIEDGELDFVA